ncbi:uncharacterized protein LOC125420625 [Ziziphus jujuba]|uniref:Uncharacterized protein LOC125420625 n=1 Tax=Ziziphus jujuba TaxID=326968 RepID=A0ABM3I8F9_ZIZJJ|nr:uncharacterized protein LOC125420625 [Ziziphus jujuba]
MASHSSSRTRSNRFSSSSPNSSSKAFASSSSSSFSSHSSAFYTRSSSPTRVRMYGLCFAPSSRSVRFAIDRPTSPGRSISMRKQSIGGGRNENGNGSRGVVSNQKKTSTCSPTTYRGSFRCSLHKILRNNGGLHVQDHTAVSQHSSSRLNWRRSAMTSSLVRIGGVEGDLVRRALSALIRPSSHQQRRRAAFQPRPSRLSIMSKADDF